MEALRVHRKVVEKELECAQKTLTREKKSLEDLKRKYKIMTLDFQLDMARINARVRRRRSWCSAAARSPNEGTFVPISGGKDSQRDRER